MSTLFRKFLLKNPKNLRSFWDAFIMPCNRTNVRKGGSMHCTIENLNECLRELELMTESGRKAMEDTRKDCRSRAPSWIAQEVVPVYNVKKGDLLPNSNLSIKMTESGDVLALKYTGSLLTPQHFGMTPKKRGAGSYTMKMGVLRGNKKQYGQYLKKKKRNGPYSEKSGNILMLNGGTVPAQRVSKDRNDIEVVRGPSAASMVVSDKVEMQVTNRLSEEMSKRLEHNLERRFK